jgi:hypothetical protein
MKSKAVGERVAANPLLAFVCERQTGGSVLLR